MVWRVWAQGFTVSLPMLFQTFLCISQPRTFYLRLMGSKSEHHTHQPGVLHGEPHNTARLLASCNYVVFRRMDTRENRPLLIKSAFQVMAIAIVMAWRQTSLKVDEHNGSAVFYRGPLVAKFDQMAVICCGRCGGDFHSFRLRCNKYSPDRLCHSAF